MNQVFPDLPLCEVESLRSRSIDTNPDAEHMHISLLRKAGIARRFELACSFSNTIMELSRQAIKDRNPELTERETELRIVALFYGDDLARRLRADLERRQS